MTGMTESGSGQCFVIMPFGRRTGPGGEELDFDWVFHQVIAEPVRAAGYEVVRSDRIMHAGRVHTDMFTHVATDDVAVVDLTFSNPNVFYELGVRHALRPSITVLIKARGSSVPFNVAGERVIEYPAADGSYATTRDQIRTFIEAGRRRADPDSPIFAVLGEARRDTRRERLTALHEYPYRLIAQPERRISVVTGDIRQWRGIDVWVNSENTNMQMARYHDQSLSAMIRYEGARKDGNGEVLEDTIADELAVEVSGRETVTPGSVYVTGPGALARRSQVKRIFHTAATHGAPGGGYRMVENIERCVAGCLDRIDSDFAGELTSIVFPMMGTGEGRADVHLVAPRLIGAALAYFTTNPDSRIEKVYFSAWNQRDLDACQSALTHSAVEPSG